MTVFSNINDAYAYFQPYNPTRVSETVVIHEVVDGKEKTRFLHWDKEKPYKIGGIEGKGAFDVDDHRGTVYGFPGPHIDKMGKQSRAFLNPDPAPEGARLQ